ncbi:MAG: LuxR C-terminal-related transcriptional regulator [Rhodomicrobium sp.]
MEHDDDEPARFLYCLTQALRGLNGDVGDAAQALLAGSALAAPRAVVSTLINDLDQLEDDAFLVVDDYQWIQDESIHDAVAFLVLHAPARLHLIITSRSAIKLPLARLRARGEWLELDATALRFDEEETRHFLQAACPQPPTAAQIRRLHARTDGWPAALRIAALGTGGAGMVDLPDLGASRAFAHLIEDLLESLPEPTVQFMARTAVLDRLNAELCNAVTGTAGSAMLIEQMVQSCLLVSPLEGDGRWWSYHQLLLDYLRGPLTQRLRIDPAGLHRRAAHWFAREGAWTDAVRHALAAGDSTLALEWLAQCGMALVKKGDLMTLLGWRRQFPPELMRKQPDVQLAVAWGLTLAMRYGDAEPVLAELEQDSIADATANARAQCQAVRAVAAALQDDSLRAMQLAESWPLEHAANDAWTTNVLSNVMRFAHWKAARWVEVYEQPWVPYSLEDDQRNVFSTVYREVLLGYVELEQARLDVAGRRATEALRLADLHTGPQSAGAALAVPLWATLAYERGQFDSAEARLPPLMSLIDNTVNLDGVMLAYLVLARIAYARGGSVHAYALLEHAEAIGYNRGWDRLVGAMLLERLRWLAAEGRLDEASACCVRLGRLAANHAGSERCARSDLWLYRDWGQAHLALAGPRSTDAIDGFARLYAEARALRFEYRALQLGTSLALAHMAAGDCEAAFHVLRQVLKSAQRSGAARSILDLGADVRAMLTRFLVSDQREPALTPCVQRLLASREGAASEPADAAMSSLTDRERRVLALVALGQSNKEVARSLDISIETVKTHLKNVFTKLGVKQRVQAATLARSFGLIENRQD